MDVSPSLNQQQHSFHIDVDKAELECLVSNQKSNYDWDEKTIFHEQVQAISDVMMQLRIDPAVLKEALNGKLVQCIKRYNPVCYDVLRANNVGKLHPQTMQE